MKKSLLILGLTMAAASQGAWADEPKPDNEFSFNLAAVSDYRYRGISQTRLEPALQGGVDYTNNPTGLYLGAWASNIHWIADDGGSGNVELDIYGGKRGELGQDLTYDVGVLSYVYAANGLGNISGSANADTTEVYAQLGYGPAYAKYSYALTNLFGFVDSKGSGYLDLGANLDLPSGFTLNLHGGHQTVSNNQAYSYTDWKIGLSKDFGPVSGALSWIGTNTTAYIGPAPDRKQLGKKALVLSISKVF